MFSKMAASQSIGLRAGAAMYLVDEIYHCNTTVYSSFTISCIYYNAHEQILLNRNDACKFI